MSTKPYEGIEPILFGMSREKVLAYLGSPLEIGPRDKTDLWVSKYTNNVSYDENDLVKHIGVCAGSAVLTIEGSLIWDGVNHQDPNPVLLKPYPNPIEKVGFLYFMMLGVYTFGYHDDDEIDYEDELGLVAFTRSRIPEILKNARVLNLQKYGIPYKPGE